MEVTTLRRGTPAYPDVIEQRVHLPPEQLYCLGTPLQHLLNQPRVAIVGSRNITAYGRHVTQQIATQLAGQGIVIVSGLALGVDGEAHKAALAAGGTTLAVLPSPVESVAPAAHQYLARQILSHGGTLISSYAAGSMNHKLNFVERNQYVAALSDGVLIVEAAAKSGSMSTAEFALSMNVPLMVVPGNITSVTSGGTNSLLKAGKAAPILSAQDVLHELGIGTQLALPKLRGDTPAEQAIIDLLLQGITDGQQLLEQSGQSVSSYNQTLTMLEIGGKVRPVGGNHWVLA